MPLSNRGVPVGCGRWLRAAGAVLALLSAPSAHAQYVVNDPGDAADASLLDGICATAGSVCTLRAAIQQMNASGGGSISFDLAGAGPHTITPGTALPVITQSATIDGYTQPGAVENTNETDPAAGPPQGSNAVLKIVLNGGGLNSPGLQFRDGTHVVRGLAINGFDGDKIYMLDGSGHKIEGNFIGTDVTGSVDASFTGRGIQVNGAPGCTIGGVLPDQRNVIAGNNVNVYANFTGMTGASGALKVQGNLIGTNAAGSAALGAGTGISVTGGTNPAIRPPDDHVIGGNDADDGSVDGRVQARNVITGHSIEIHSTNSLNTRISGNFIGTDVTGEIALGDFAGWGVEIDGISTDTLLGGWSGSTPAGAPNIICCVGVAVLVSGGGNTDGVQVLGNQIGSSPSGQPLGNGTIGIDLASVSQVTVGGPDPFDTNAVVHTGSSSSHPGVRVTNSSDSLIEGNLIAHGAGRGVFMDTLSRRVRISANGIFDNGQVGIDLTSSGQLSTFVTPNDPSDVDTGGNELQNFPLLTSATALLGVDGLTVIGSLNSQPSSTFEVEFFASDDTNKDPSGYGEGEQYLETLSVVTDVFGNAAFSQAIAPTFSVAPGTVLTATATDSAGNTSEFGNWIAVAVGDPDGDGVSLGDNCPLASNPGQSDAGGVGIGSAADGIGDACQCGDVNDDGFVTGLDGTLIKRAALGLAPFTSGVGALAAPNKCDVNGGATGDAVFHCSGLDATVIQRVSLGLAPGVQQFCPAADGS